MYLCYHVRLQYIGTNLDGYLHNVASYKGRYYAGLSTIKANIIFRLYRTLLE